jgi:DNA modification methylase
MNHILLSTDEHSALEQHEATIEHGLKTFVEVGNALSAIRDARLYRASHATFEEYCQERWQMARQTAYQYIGAAAVVENVRNCGHLPATESQARPLTSLAPEQQPVAWQRSVETAPNGKPTAAHVQSVVNEMRLEEKQEAQDRAREIHADTISYISSLPQRHDENPISLWENQIFTGDARDVLGKMPAQHIDLVLTDPPYNIGFSAYDLHEDALTEEDYVSLLRKLQAFKKIVVIQYPEETMRYVIPALGAPDHVGAWCYNSNISRRFRLINYYGITPDYSRVRQAYKNPTDKRIQKLMESGRMGSPLYEWWDDIQIVKNVSKEKGNHPCPVPIRLMERIILLTTEPGDMVLDPFVGEGTTAIAAQQSERRYIGVELSPDYAETARRRLEESKRERGALP